MVDGAGWWRLFLGGVVGLVETPQGVPEIFRGLYLEGKPARSRSNARLLEGALIQIRRDGIESEYDGVGSVEPPRDRQSGEDFLASIHARHAKHRPVRDLRPANQFCF